MPKPTTLGVMNTTARLIASILVAGALLAACGDDEATTTSGNGGGCGTGGGHRVRRPRDRAREPGPYGRQLPAASLSGAETGVDISGDQAGTARLFSSSAKAEAYAKQAEKTGDATTRSAPWSSSRPARRTRTPSPRPTRAAEPPGRYNRCLSAGGERSLVRIQPERPFSTKLVYKVWDAAEDDHGRAGRSSSLRGRGIPTISIIGGGTGGNLLAARLLEVSDDGQRLHVMLIEARGRAGPRLRVVVREAERVARAHFSPGSGGRRRPSGARRATGARGTALRSDLGRRSSRCPDRQCCRRLSRCG